MKLEIRNLSVKLKHTSIIQNLSLDLNEGVHGLLGPNGAGKTTLLRSIAGLYPQKKGEVNTEAHPIQASEIGYLPQKFGAFPGMTIYEFLSYMGHLKNIPKNHIKDDIETVITKVNLKDKLYKRISTLSGGMVRRVGIAQAMLGNPDVLILDEPSANLDPEERVHFKEILMKEPRDKIIILSTHIVEDVAQLCDRIEIMDHGKILHQGSQEELLLTAKEKRNSQQPSDDSDISLEEAYLWLIKQ